MASYYLAGDLVGKWICFTITVISLTFQFMKLNVPYTGVPFSHNELVSFNSYIIVIACYFTYFMTKKFSTSEKELIRIANESEKENLNSQKEIIGLLSILSHDISNPVTIIQSHLKRIDRSTEKEDQEIYIKKIEQKIEDMMTVLDEVKDLSLVKYGSKVVKLSEVNLPERLKKELMNYHEQLNKRNISVQKSWDNKDDFTILAENYSLNYVILNYLIGNAIDYCKENGCIKFSIFKNNKGVVLSIDITGNEIPSRLLGSNFFSINQANFFKQHFSKKGTGLSLPLCKEFLDLIDGKIVVSNSDVGIIIKVIFKDSFMDQKIAA
jgi:signal transduction histidine kinase